MVLLEDSGDFGLAPVSALNLVKGRYEFKETEAVDWDLLSKDRAFGRAEPGGILLRFAAKPQGITERRGTLAEIARKRYGIDGCLMEEESAPGPDLIKTGVLQVPERAIRPALKLLYQMYTCAGMVLCKEQDAARAAHWLVKNPMFRRGYTIDAVTGNVYEVLARGAVVLYALRGCNGCAFNFLCRREK